MLFSSQAFLLLFLPLSLICYYACADSYRARLLVLTVASMIFYAWWDVRFVPLLIGMIALTWFIARLHDGLQRPWILIAGIVANLSVLALFKYANFFAENVLDLFGVAYEPWQLILPLGISFFTFQQVSYLVDRLRDQAPAYGFAEYAAYVSFFPQLIAGPIVRHNQLIGQFILSPRRAETAEMAARGATLFTLGLIKKVLFADELAPIADAGFDAAAGGALIGFEDAWLAALAYSVQLYFDFSAYSDMAMGLGAMFGLSLPINFDAPYRATDIRVFWRRWHMTLSSFFRDYVYIPLGGSRGGLLRTCVIVIATMLLCGLWHGAGWTFVVWGALHGAAICVNRFWGIFGRRLPAPFAWLSTMLFVVFAWVVFRAENFEVVNAFVHAMVHLTDGGIAAIDDEAVLYVAIGLGFALLGPTNVGISQWPRLHYRRYAFAVACALLIITLRVGQGRGLEFIYFQF